MFDKLEDLLVRLEEILSELNEPGVANDPARFQKLMKEQSELQPIVDAYKEYKACQQTVEESLMMLDEESDEEMREMLKEELADAKSRIEELETELKILLLPKDPNDSKNVIVEIRAGAGGDEAALFAAEIYRMYVKYAESRRWKTELMSLNENGIGGFKEVTFMINGAGAYSRLKYESGVHRVQRVPETESGGRIHTSTITVAIMPEAEEIDFQLDLNDCKFDLRLTLVAAIVFLAVFFLTHYVSLGSLLVYVVFVAGIIIMGQNGQFTGMSQANIYEMYVLAILLAILAYYKHWPNILRLIHGNENKTYLKKKKA